MTVTADRCEDVFGLFNSKMDAFLKELEGVRFLSPSEVQELNSKLIDLEHEVGFEIRLNGWSDELDGEVLRDALATLREPFESKVRLQAVPSPQPQIQRPRRYFHHNKPKPRAEKLRPCEYPNPHREPVIRPLLAGLFVRHPGLAVLLFPGIAFVGMVIVAMAQAAPVVDSTAPIVELRAE